MPERDLWTGTNAVVDAGWGDNGKGKLVDIGAQHADMVFRWAGGPNAGHTVRNHLGEFKFHLMPSGIFSALCVLGDTVVIDPDVLLAEMDELAARGFTVDENNLLISLDASLILDWHKKRDGLTEIARGGKGLGTTGRGIGPAYADRTERTGLKVHHLFDPNLPDILMKEFTWQSKLTRAMLGQHETVLNAPYDFNSMLDRLNEARRRLEPMATNVIPLVRDLHNRGGNVLGEGAQGALLDLDLGTTPYVTSSHPTIEGFGIATGIHADQVKNVYAAIRAYGARVGEGPFPTELLDDTGDYIRETGHEYGTTTGRPRRCGWFDAVLTHYGARISGAREIALTKLDVLDELPEVKICVGYDVDGVQYNSRNLPTVKPRFLDHAKPVYETMRGWQTPTREAKTFEDLPKDAQYYVWRIEELLDMPIPFVFVGPDREETIVR